MTSFILKYLVIPILVALEIIGIAYYYPIYKDTFWKSLILVIIVFAMHDVYRHIMNYCETLNP